MYVNCRSTRFAVNSRREPDARVAVQEQAEGGNPQHLRRANPQQELSWRGKRQQDAADEAEAEQVEGDDQQARRFVDIAPGVAEADPSHHRERQEADAGEGEGMHRQGVADPRPEQLAAVQQESEDHAGEREVHAPQQRAAPDAGGVPTGEAPAVAGGGGEGAVKG